MLASFLEVLAAGWGDLSAKRDDNGALWCTLGWPDVRAWWLPHRGGIPGAQSWEVASIVTCLAPSIPADVTLALH